MDEVENEQDIFGKPLASGTGSLRGVEQAPFSDREPKDAGAEDQPA